MDMTRATVGAAPPEEPTSMRALKRCKQPEEDKQGKRPQMLMLEKYFPLQSFLSKPIPSPYG